MKNKRRVPCKVCGKLFYKQGMGPHMKLKHHKNSMITANELDQVVNEEPKVNLFKAPGYSEEEYKLCYDILLHELNELDPSLETEHQSFVHIALVIKYLSKKIN